MLKKIQKIFNKNHIVVKKILCTSYVKSNDNINKNIFQSAYDLVKGKNKQEVVIVPKKPEKKVFLRDFFTSLDKEIVFSCNISCFLIFNSSLYNFLMSVLNQKTINDTIEFQGIGLHSGKNVNLKVKPAEPNTGIIFKRTDLKKVIILFLKYLMLVALCSAQLFLMMKGYLFRQ